MNTWSDFFTVCCIAAAFFFAGRIWGYEAQWREEEKRAARRRANRININTRKGSSNDN